MKIIGKLGALALGLSALVSSCGRVSSNGADNASNVEEYQMRDEQRGVNMDAYCKRAYGQNFFAKLIGPTTGDWVCETDPHNTRGINVKQACLWQQNTDRVGVRNVNDPLSWYCLVSVRVWVPVRVGVNMDAYCKRAYGQDFSSKLIGPTVGDWVCETDPHNTRGINVKQACIWQQGTDRVGYTDVNNPLSWYCEK